MFLFEELWFLEKEFVFGFFIYCMSQNYDNFYYECVDIGGEIYMCKCFFELVVGCFFYSYNEIKIQDIDILVFIGVVEGKMNIFKVGFQLECDICDKIVNMIDGGCVEFNFEVVGGLLGGIYDYYCIEGCGFQFFLIFWV